MKSGENRAAQGVGIKRSQSFPMPRRSDGQLELMGLGMGFMSYILAWAQAAKSIFLFWRFLKVSYDTVKKLCSIGMTSFSMRHMRWNLPSHVRKHMAR